MKFYPSDWRSDAALRSCSLAARGIWIEMIALMHEAEPYGHLVINGRPIALGTLAGLSGASPKLLKRCLEELETAGVFSRTEDGIVYSRRMVRDAQKALQDKENGRRGGNPNVAKGVNPPDNPPVKPKPNGEDKAQKPEARSQIPDKETAAATARTREPWPDQKIAEALGPELAAFLPSQETAHFVGQWLRDGADLERDVIPSVQRVLARRRSSVSTWGYFTKAVRETCAANIAPPNPIMPNEAPHEQHHAASPPRFTTAADRERAATDARRSSWPRAIELAKRLRGDGGNVFDSAGEGSGDGGAAARLIGAGRA